MQILFAICRARVSSAEPTIRPIRAQMQIYLQFAEREYLRRSQRYDQSERKCKFYLQFAEILTFYITRGPAFTDFIDITAF